MIIFLAVIAIIAFLLFVPVKVEIRFKNKKTDIRVKVLGIPIKRLPPAKEIRETHAHTKEMFEKDTKKFTQKLHDFAAAFKSAVRLTRKYVKIKNVEVKINFGTGEAASTAVSTGVLWPLVCGAVSAISLVAKTDKPTIEITPAFNECFFNYEGMCIISSRLVYITIIALKILLKIKSRED